MAKICSVCGIEIQGGYISRKYCRECTKMIRRAFVKNKRFSGIKYENSPERLSEIKSKYKNGIPKNEIRSWIFGM